MKTVFVILLLAFITDGHCDDLCPFMVLPQCSCYKDSFVSNDNKYNIDITCYSDNVTLPTFPQISAQVTDKYIIRTITLVGSYQGIPPYAFANLQPRNILFKRAGFPLTGLLFDLNAFQYFNGTAYNITFDSIEFDNFETSFLEVPSAVLAMSSYIGRLSFTRSYFWDLLNESFNEISAATITLDSCSIQTIEVNAFINIKAIVSLDLSNNLLTDVPSAALGAAALVGQINLSNNKITSLLDNAFSSNNPLTHSNVLQAITLDNNPIGDNISTSAFNNLPALDLLSLSKVGLSRIPIEALHPVLKVLSVLDISYNNLQTIPSGTFQNFAQLAVLMINNNPIVNLQPGSLIGLQTEQLDITYLPLTTLDVSVTNGIKKLQQLKTENCPALQRLSLSDLNQLPSTLNEIYAKFVNTLSNTTQVIPNIDSNFESWLESNSKHHLSINSNRFVCNSSMFWMAEYLLCPPYQITLDNGKCLDNEQTVRDYLEHNVNVTCIPYTPGGCNKNIVQHFVVYFVVFVILKLFVW